MSKQPAGKQIVAEQLVTEVQAKMQEFLRIRQPCLICDSHEIVTANAIFPNAEFRRKINGHPEAIVYTLCATCAALPEGMKNYAIEKRVTQPQKQLIIS